MSTHVTHDTSGDDELPDSFDDRQPDLPTKAVDPDPETDEGQETGFEPLRGDSGAH